MFNKDSGSKHLDEMVTIHKKESDLSVNIYLDDSLSYKRRKHAKQIIFQTDYADKPITNTFASMNFTGELIGTNSLPNEDITKIRNFVKNNLAAIESLADMDIGIVDFLKVMIPGGNPATEEAKKNQLISLPALMTEQENIAENIKIIETGTCLHKKRTKLPANIFLDDTGNWTQSGQWGHCKIIKFQADNDHMTQTNIIIPMSIDENPQILIDNPEISLIPSEIEQIKTFVRNNKDLLLQLDALEIDFFDFMEKMRLSCYISGIKFHLVHFVFPCYV
ncbi:hypothetical protein LQZ19_10355 [Treponema primitia]|uniref:hypothetical protein n=1 Tax=Treponema primitia TaxID=88058 RepID=UPI0039812651